MAVASSATITVSFGSTGFTVSGTITRSSQSYRHIVHIYFNDLLLEDVFNVTNTFSRTYSFNTIGRQIPNSVSGKFTVRVSTYNGSAIFGNTGTYIGDRSYNKTVTLPSSVVPTITSFTYTYDSSLSVNGGAFLQRLTKLTINPSLIDASGIYGSTIERYKVSVTGGSYWTFGEAGKITFTLEQAGTINVTLTVTDSRGRTAQKAKQITVVPYNYPSISDVRVTRLNTSNVEDDEGTKLSVGFTLSGTQYPDHVSDDVFSYKIETATKGSSSWTTKTSGSITGTEAGSAGHNGVPVEHIYTGYSANTAYQVRITVTDDFGSTTSQIVELDSAKPVMDFRSNGKGIALFGVSTEDGLVVNSTSKFNDTVTVGTYISSGVNGRGQNTTGSDMWILLAKSDYPTTSTSTQGNIRIHGPFGTYQASSRSYIDMMIPLREFTAGSPVTVVANTFDQKNTHCLWLYILMDADDYLYVYAMATANSWYHYDLYFEGSGFEIVNTILSEPPSEQTQVWNIGDNDAINGTNVINFLEVIYPVGSIYISTTNTSPANWFGGTWKRLNTGYLYGVSSATGLGVVAGSMTRTISVSNMPAHDHNIKAYRTNREVSQAGAPQVGSTGSFADRVMVYSANAISKNYTESISEVRGSGTSLDIKPGYITCAVWERTA